jgi:2-octaprenyl-6-methoxyphenol hydroxylase
MLKGSGMAAHGQSRRLPHIHAMTKVHDVLIVGGGLTGPSLALALADAGLSVMLVDARPLPARAKRDFDGRAYSLAIGSKRLLDMVGIWTAVSDLSEPILRVEAGDGTQNGPNPPFFLGFDSADLEEGPMGFMLEDRHLYAALIARMQQHPKIALTTGAKVLAQAVHGGLVHGTLDTGETIVARVLIGCDGRASGTAERAGIRRQGWGYDQTALVCAVRHDTPHGGVARQVFLKGGPLAMLPLKGGHHSSIVWSEQDGAASRISDLPDAAYLAEVQCRIGTHLGQVSLAGNRFSYPLSLSLAERFVTDRIALVGDAAHGVHPIAGQGLNLGMRDVGALAEVLVEAARRGEDIGAVDVLARYERWRRSDATTLALGMDVVNRLFSNDNALLHAARSLGLKAVASVPTLRRAFQREAAGLSGDLPRLLAGRQI